MTTSRVSVRVRSREIALTYRRQVTSVHRSAEKGNPSWKPGFRHMGTSRQLARALIAVGLRSESVEI